MKRKETMKFLAKLERKKLCWLIIIACIFFFFLRLPSIIEPYWYGDEGVYEVVGQAMDHGRLLYRDIWDNKPPLLYSVYALSLGDQSTVKVFSIIVGIISIVFFFLLSQKLFNKPRITFPITFLYILLLGSPILEGNIANAENFLLPFTILAGLIIYNLSNSPQNETNNPKNSSIFNRKSLIFTAGLLVGVAFLFKIVAVFDLLAFLIFFVVLKLPENVSFSVYRKAEKNELGIMSRELWTNFIIPNSLFMILGFLLPLFLTTLFFLFNNALLDFLQTVFFGNISYVGWKNTFFNIPQGLLILKGILLIIVLSIIFWKRKLFTKASLFIILWLVFSLFNVFFSERPYTHYVIVLLPSFCLLIGLLFASTEKMSRIKILTGIAAVVALLISQFTFNIKDSYQYYPNAIQFLTNKESVKEYQTFFDPHVPRDYMLSEFIIKNTKASDTVFIWGNSPQIYAMSDKLPPGKYTVAYHIIQNNAFEETQGAIAESNPKYIIVLQESAPLPFALPLYIMQYTLPGATIYERSL